MTCLLYGVVFSSSRKHAGASPPPALPPGVGSAAVRLLEEGTLGAAVSELDQTDLTPTVGRLLSYAKVVDALHADRAVLPMRYGCLFEDERQVVDLVRSRGTEYAAVLRGLDGCVEMGVRVLSFAGPPLPRGARPGAASGRAYLVDRTARYLREEEASLAFTEVTQRLRTALGGLAERTTTDSYDVWADRRVASLCFLVKREAVDGFRQAFRRLEQAEPAGLLLSGPWPPYSFVAPSPNGDQCG